MNRKIQLLTLDNPLGWSAILRVGTSAINPHSQMESSSLRLSGLRVN